MEVDNARVPALVLVSVPPVTVEPMVRSEPALTSTLFPAVASVREPPEIVPPPLEVIPEVVPRVRVPDDVTEPPFTAREPLSVVVPSESVPAFVTAPSVLPDAKVAEPVEAMVNALVPDRTVLKVSDPPLPTETRPVKALSEVAFTARMPLVERLPAPLNKPVNVPPPTLRTPELLTVPLLRVDTTTVELEPMLKLPVASERTVLVPVPEIPTEPPLMPPARVAVPPMLSVP